MRPGLIVGGRFMTTTGTNPAFKVEYLQPFVDGLKILFESHLSDSLKIGKPFSRPNARAPHDISGVIVFTGTVVGRAVISFPMGVAEKVAADFSKVDSVSPDLLEDCVGELANIVIGRAKGKLEGHNIVISPPTVLHGSDYTIAPQRNAACLSIPCECRHGNLQLDISIVENTAPGA